MKLTREIAFWVVGIFVGIIVAAMLGATTGPLVIGVGIAWGIRTLVKQAYERLSSVQDSEPVSSLSSDRSRNSFATVGVSVALVITTSLLIWRVILVAGALDDVGAGTVTQLQYDAIKTTDVLVVIAWGITAILFARWLYVKVQEYAPVDTGRWWTWLIPFFNFYVLIKVVWNLDEKAGASWGHGTIRTLILIWAGLLLTGEVVSNQTNTMSLDTLSEAQYSLRVLMVRNVLWLRQESYVSHSFSKSARKTCVESRLREPPIPRGCEPLRATTSGSHLRLTAPVTQVSQPCTLLPRRR